MGTRIGAPQVGEMLAGRYRLDHCIIEYLDPHGQLSGRALWQGTDEILARQVAIELRVPGGPSSEQFLSTAMVVSRIVNARVIGVYDAVDEGDRAYVVREWVRGQSLEATVADAPLSPALAAVAARDTAEGLAAIHAAGAVHGNINPASVIIHSDGGVTLTDLQLEESGAAVAPSADVRSVGAVLYAALTGRWPAEIPTPRATLPDALRADGKLCSPRQIRAGIPSYLDALTMDLLDPSIPTPPAAELAAELRRFDLSSPDAGVLDALPVDPPTRRSPWRRAVLPLAGLLVIALLGWIFGTRGLPVGNGPGYPETKAPAKNSGSSSPGNGPLPVAAVRILDPGGDGTELANAGRAADSRRATSWKTQVYTRPRFGNLKSGMGVLLDLGAVHEVRQVTIYLDQPGGALELRTGTGGADPAAYRLVASRNNARSALSFEVPAGVSSRYWLVWITELPLASGGGGYGLAVQEIVLVS